MKEKLQRRTKRHGRIAEEELREVLRNGLPSDGVVRAPLGSRIVARFRRVGLTEEIPELRGESVRPAEFEP
jgi:plasmid stability protein